MYIVKPADFVSIIYRVC